MPKPSLIELTCMQCGYTWPPRKEEVRQCPSCRSFDWTDEDVEKIKLVQLKCLNEKCGYEWYPRRRNVMSCPKCKTRLIKDS